MNTNFPPMIRPDRAARRGLAACCCLVLGLTAGACAPRLQMTGPMTGEARIMDDALIARDGARLPLRRWGPEAQKPWAVLVALHGFNDYSNAFDDAARHWAKKGVVTYAIDQRGFGRSAQTGLWAGIDAMVADLRALAAAVRKRHPGLPLHVLGDSMGGAVAMVTLARHPGGAIDGAILAAPAVWGRRHLGAIKRGALWLTAHTLPWVTLTPEGLDIKASDNVAMLRKLGKDPLVIKETRVDTVWGLVNLMDAAFAAADGIDAPLLLLYGARDEVIPKQPTAEVLAKVMARGRARAAYYPNGYHMLLRDLRADAVLGDVLAWIRDHRAALPSGAEAEARKWLGKKD
jgi:alpha-beta hydrolase superfamily lysophospholipase